MDMIFEYIQHMLALTAKGKLQGVWFFVAVYALLVCMYSAVYQIRLRGWASTLGELKQLGMDKFGYDNSASDQNYQVGADYTYVVDGKEYLGNNVSSWGVIASANARFVLRYQLKGVEQYPGNKIKVYYHPKKPNKCLLILPSVKGVVFTFVVSVLPALAYWHRFYG